jgi:transposase-like protein
VGIQRPRVRTDGEEVALPTFTALSATDPLDVRVLEQMLVGVATRRYARSLEPVGVEVTTRGTSKSTVSRRFVAKTTAQLAAWRTAPLDQVDLVALFIDGVAFADDCVVVALGVDGEGRKHALGVWHGSTENATLCQGLLRDLQGRGLRTDRSMLVVLDGSKALAKAIRYAFDRAAVVQRCQVHKLRNVLEYLPDGQRPWVRAQMQRAYQASDVRKATRLLMDLARRLETEYPSAAESLREGLEETLTVMRLALSARLQRTFATTNPIENLISGTRRVHRNVKRWRNGTMMQRWAAAGILEAAKGFRRIKGHRDLPSLVQVLRARDRELGLDQDQSTAAVA